MQQPSSRWPTLLRESWDTWVFQKSRYEHEKWKSLVVSLTFELQPASTQDSKQSSPKCLPRCAERLARGLTRRSLPGGRGQANEHPRAGEYDSPGIRAAR